VDEKNASSYISNFKDSSSCSSHGSNHLSSVNGDADLDSDDSFNSDSSYYDEVEDFELACINEDQIENRKYTKMAMK
jgi:hypothetical protein